MLEEKTVAIVLGGDNKLLETFVADLKISLRYKNSKLVNCFEAHEMERHGTVYYLYLEDHPWSDSLQQEAKAICQLADRRQLSYCFITHDERYHECNTDTNAESSHYLWHVQSLFRFERAPFKLADRRFDTFFAWLVHRYTQDELADICNHGCAGGFHGLTYYHETSALYDKYHEEIWTVLDDMRADYGHASIFELLSFGTGALVNNDVHFKNFLVWLVAEKYAFDITGGEYPDSNDNEDEDNQSDAVADQ